MARKRRRTSLMASLFPHKKENTPQIEGRTQSRRGERHTDRQAALAPALAWLRHPLGPTPLPRYAAVAAGGVLVILAVAAALLLRPRQAVTQPAQRLLWQGQVIATVSDAAEVNQQYEAWRRAQETLHGMTLAAGSPLTWEEIRVEEAYQCCDAASVLPLLQRLTQQSYRGAVLQVSGHDILAMTDAAAIEALLEALKEENKQAILAALSTQGAPVTEFPEAEIAFAETVEVTERILCPEDTVTHEEALGLLQENVGSAQTSYTVCAGDNLARIAEAFDTTQEALLEANPEVTSPDLIRVGQELRLGRPSRALNLVISFTQTRKETVPHTTEKKNNGSMLKGKTKVTQEGEDGISIITAQESYLNGTLVDRTVLSETVEKEMVPEIVQVGTKVLNSRGNPVFPYPVSGYRISSRFGPRDIDIGSRDHKGIDLAVPKGTPVYAAADGVVSVSGDVRGYGLVVYIEHDDGYQTRYGHNSKLLVKKGDTVKKGQKIALAGNTGVSSGPHCHFEIRKNGRAVNPEHYQ